MLIENVAVDFIAITYMKDGIWGIGLATGIGYNVAALIMLANFFRKRSAFRFSPKHVKPTVLFSVVKLGTPNLTRQGCRLIAPLTINRMILAVGGSAAMAAMSVLNTLLAICTSPGNGVSRSVDLLAQIYHSEQDRPALRRIATEAMRLLILMSAPFIVGVLIFAKPLASFYIHGDPVALKYTVIAMICLSFTILPNAANFTVMDYLRGCRQLLPTHLYTFSHMLLWKLIATFTLTRLFGVTGVFVAIPVAEFLTIGVYVLLTLMLKRNGTPMDRVLLLPKDFGHAAEDTLAFTVTTVEEAVQGSEKIGAFCKARGVDERRTLYAALCSEELLANVVTHGFTKDHKAHSCDVRVMKEGEDVVLRIRDDCRYFNLKERYEAITASTVDVTSHIGIRMVYAMAKDIRYVNLLDTNTLIIRI
ncbi:MAG: hypothetical protein MJ099_03675, partial [Clostridia bacterium]|nr:hypothetical protein [Clostridia bacterium]